MGIMLGNFEEGLSKEQNAKAKVKMFQTYVKSVPDGTGESVNKKFKFLYDLCIYLNGVCLLKLSTSIFTSDCLLICFLLLNSCC